MEESKEDAEKPAQSPKIENIVNLPTANPGCTKKKLNPYSSVLQQIHLSNTRQSQY